MKHHSVTGNESKVHNGNDNTKYQIIIYHQLNGLHPCSLASGKTLAPQLPYCFGLRLLFCSYFSS